MKIWKRDWSNFFVSQCADKIFVKQKYEALSVSLALRRSHSCDQNPCKIAYDI